jgi:hypothetical protein
LGGTGRESGEVAATNERTRRADSRLGEPTKQNADERRARLGRPLAVKRSSARETRGRKQGTAFRQNEGAQSLLASGAMFRRRTGKCFGVAFVSSEKTFATAIALDRTASFSPRGFDEAARAPVGRSPAPALFGNGDDPRSVRPIECPALRDAQPPRLAQETATRRAALFPLGRRPGYFREASRTACRIGHVHRGSR